MVLVLVSRSPGCTHLVVVSDGDDDPGIYGRCRWCAGFAVQVADDDLAGYETRLDARLRPLGGRVAGRVRGTEN